MGASPSQVPCTDSLRDLATEMSSRKYAQRINLIHCFRAFRVKYANPIRYTRCRYRIVEVVDQDTVWIEEIIARRKVTVRNRHLVRLTSEYCLVKRPHSHDLTGCQKYTVRCITFLKQLQQNRTPCRLTVVGLGYDIKMLGDLIIEQGRESVVYQLLRFEGSGQPLPPNRGGYLLE